MIKGGKKQLRNTKPVTFSGINLKSKSKLGKKSDIEIEDLSTIVEIDMKDLDTPSILRKKK